MKEKTKRKILGNWLYRIYRRLRYIRYTKKLTREKKKQLKLEAIREKGELKTNLRKQKRIDRHEAKHQKALLKREEKNQKKLVRKEIKEKLKQERNLAKKQAKEAKAALSEERHELKARMKIQAEAEKSLLKDQKRKLKIEKLLRKHRIRKLRPYLFRRRFREFFRGIRSINRRTIREWFRWIVFMAENRQERNRFLKIYINSTALFVFSYLLMFSIGQLVTIWVASTFDFSTILFPFKIYYDIESTQWSADAVKILYSIIPVMGLVLGIIFIIIYSTKRNDTNIFKLFFLWGFAHGMVMFFGSILIGTLLNQGFGWVIAYLYYRDTGKMIFSIIAIFALVIAGVSISRSFLISGNSYFNYIKSQNRKLLLMSQVLLPAISGTVILALIKIPADFYYTTSEEVWFEVMKISTVILILLPIILAFRSVGDIYFDEEPRRIRFIWPVLLLAIAFCLLYYFGLSAGIHFRV